MKVCVFLFTGLFHETVAVICHILNVTFRFTPSLVRVGQCVNVCASGTSRCHRKPGRVTRKRGPHPGNGPSDRSPSIFITQRCRPARTQLRTGEKLRTGSRLFSSSTNFTSWKAPLYQLSRLASTYRTIITTRSLLLMY